MKKKVIRLTEEDLRDIVLEVAGKILEGDDVKKMLATKNGLTDLPHSDDLFDLTTFTREELDYIKDRYATYVTLKGYDALTRRTVIPESFEPDFKKKVNNCLSKIY